MKTRRTGESPPAHIQQLLRKPCEGNDKGALTLERLGGFWTTARGIGDTRQKPESMGAGGPNQSRL